MPTKRYTKLTDEEREAMIEIWKTLSPLESKSARCRKIGRRMGRAHSSIEKMISRWQRTEEGQKVEAEIAARWASVTPRLSDSDESIIRLWQAQDPLLKRDERIRRISWRIGLPPSKISPAIDRWLKQRPGGEDNPNNQPKQNMFTTTQRDFIESFNSVAKEINDTAREKGWWDEDRNVGEMIALMHSELSEALEAQRHGNPPDDKIPQFSGLEAELADCIIRIMDMAPALDLDIAGALVAKMEYNKSRPYKHGKNF